MVAAVIMILILTAIVIWLWVTKEEIRKQLKRVTTSRQGGPAARARALGHDVKGKSKGTGLSQNVSRSVGDQQTMQETRLALRQPRQVAGLPAGHDQLHGSDRRELLQ